MLPFEYKRARVEDQLSAGGWGRDWSSLQRGKVVKWPGCLGLEWVCLWWFGMLKSPHCIGQTPLFITIWSIYKRCDFGSISFSEDKAHPPACGSSLCNSKYSIQEPKNQNQGEGIHSCWSEQPALCPQIHVFFKLVIFYLSSCRSCSWGRVQMYLDWWLL